MKAKFLYGGIAAALLVAVALWLARKGGDVRAEADRNAEMGSGPEVGLKTGAGGPGGGGTASGPKLRAPEQGRRFRDFTPEQRVEQARKGHGPGG